MKRWGFAQELIAAKNTLACPQQQVLHSECILGHLKALTNQVIQEHLNTWLTNHVFPKYMAALEDKDQLENLALLEHMSPLDHILSVLYCAQNDEADSSAKLDKLAREFFDACQRLGPNELLLLNRVEHVTVSNVAKRALGINMNDPRFLDRHRVFMVLFRLGQFEAVADLLKEVGCYGINAARQNNWDNPPTKRPLERG